MRNRRASRAGIITASAALGFFLVIALARPADQVPLVVLSLYNVVVGYFTAATLYREIQGEDLLSREALARQTRFLLEFVTRLFREAPNRSPSDS